MFNDIALFIRIVQYHNFTHASRELGMSQSTLSRKIAALEQQIETKLIYRDSRNLRLTSVGELLCKEFANLEEDFSQLVHSIMRLTNDISTLKKELLIDEVFLFVKLVKSGSYMRCSMVTRISKSTVSRKISELEEKLKVSLLIRDAHKMELTQFGQELYNYFEVCNSKYTELLANFMGENRKIKGHIKISLPFLLSYYYVLPKLGDFLRKNPELEITILHDQNEFNLNSKGYDLAIINYTPKQQNAKMRRLASDKVIGVCSKIYAEKYGLLTNIEDLDRHLVVGKPNINGEKFNYIDIFNVITKEKLSIPNPSRLVLNSFIHTYQLVASDTAIAALPYDIVRKSLATGELIHVLPEYHFGIVNYVLVRNLEENSPVYKVLVDFLVDCLKPLSTVLERHSVDVWYK